VIVSESGLAETLLHTLTQSLSQPVRLNSQCICRKSSIFPQFPAGILSGLFFSAKVLHEHVFFVPFQVSHALPQAFIFPFEFVGGTRFWRLARTGLFSFIP